MHSFFISLQKCYCHNKYTSTYESNISRWEGTFLGVLGFSHKKQKQDELPPYPQHICPTLPWKHLPWYQIMAPGLPTSPWKAPAGGFAIAAAGSLLGTPKHDPPRNREMDGAQALEVTANHLKNATTNQKRQCWQWRGCLRREANEGNGEEGGGQEQQ
jgi:hypothetical protein